MGTHRTLHTVEHLKAFADIGGIASVIEVAGKREVREDPRFSEAVVAIFNEFTRHELVMGNDPHNRRCCQAWPHFSRIATTRPAVSPSACQGHGHAVCHC